MGATRVVWWRLQVLGGRRRGRGQHPKGEQERGVAAKPKEGGGGRLGFWGGRVGFPPSDRDQRPKSALMSVLKQNSTVLLIYAS
jgi:hypothetical protein